MSIRLCAGAGAFLILGTASLFASYRDEVDAALRDFLGQPNYTWSVTNSRGIPEETESLGARETMGQHEKGGLTKMYFISGPHIPFGVQTSRPWPGITDRTGHSINEWVFETPEGWKRIEELPSRARAVQPGPVPGSRRGVIPVRRMSVSEARLFVRRPDQEMEIVVANIARIYKTGSGTYELEITPEGAAELAYRPFASGGPRTETAAAYVKLSIRDQTLLRYEITIEVTVISPDGNQQERKSTLIRELTDFGTTKIEVPPEALEKLAR